MKSLQVGIEQFEIFVSAVRQNVVVYSEVVQKFDCFKPIDNCFLAVSSSCCARRAAVHKDCVGLMRNFILDEKSKEFFLFFKEKYEYDQVTFSEKGASILTI